MLNDLDQVRQDLLNSDGSVNFNLLRFGVCPWLAWLVSGLHCTADLSTPKKLRDGRMFGPGSCDAALEVRVRVRFGPTMSPAKGPTGTAYSVKYITQNPRCNTRYEIIFYFGTQRCRGAAKSEASGGGISRISDKAESSSAFSTKWAYSVEKLRHAKIVSEIWNTVLATDQLASIVCKRALSREGILVIRSVRAWR